MNNNQKQNIIERINYAKSCPSAFIEEVLGIKLSTSQKLQLETIRKYQYLPRIQEKRYDFYIRMLCTYFKMNKNSYITIMNLNGIKKFDKSELLEYLKHYWD